jgi:hypothetical protein
MRANTLTPPVLLLLNQLWNLLSLEIIPRNIGEKENIKCIAAYVNMTIRADFAGFMSFAGFAGFDKHIYNRMKVVARALQY